MTEPNPAADLGYTEALAELETILDRLEHDEPDVDRVADVVARAAELVAHCRDRPPDRPPGCLPDCSAGGGQSGRRQSGSPSVRFVAAGVEGERHGRPLARVQLATDLDSTPPQSGPRHRAGRVTPLAA